MLLIGLRKHFIREMRAAASQVCHGATDVSVQLAVSPPQQAELPLGDGSADRASACRLHAVNRLAVTQHTQPGCTAAGKIAVTQSRSLPWSIIASQGEARNVQASGVSGSALPAELVAGQSTSESESCGRGRDGVGLATCAATLETFIPAVAINLLTPPR